MCLAVPGKVIEWLHDDPLTALALVEFDGVKRQVHMPCVPEAKVSDYVLVHAGIAIGTIDAEEAERLKTLLIEIDETVIAAERNREDTS